MKKILPLFMLMMQAQAFHVIEGDQRVEVTDYKRDLNGDQEILKSIVRLSITDDAFLFKTYGRCTGTLISRRKVLTAAHCVSTAFNKKLKFTGNITVYTQYQDRIFLPEKYKEKRKVKYVTFLSSSRDKSFFSSNKRKRCNFKQHILDNNSNNPKSSFKESSRCDMALLTLSDSFSKDISIAQVSNKDPKRGDVLSVAGFSSDRDSGRKLTIDANCTLRDLDRAAKGIIKHDCDFNKGASGGPTFSCKNNVCKLVGVNIFQKGYGGNPLRKYSKDGFYNGSLMFTKREFDLLHKSVDSMFFKR